MCHTHLPTPPAVGGVVICSPLFFEASENYRAEMLLTNALGARGLAAQRFDYRGCGNSCGDPRQLTLESAVQDCVLAAARLRLHANVETVGLLGTRWGALVAAGAADLIGAAAVALWEAKPDGRGYVDELARARVFTDFFVGERHPAGYHQERVGAGHPLDVRGWRIHPRVVASSVAESVSSSFRRPLPTRVVYGPGREVDGHRLRDELESLGCNVVVSVLPDRALWWVGRNRLIHPDHAAAPLELEAEPTAVWFRDRLGV